MLRKELCNIKTKRNKNKYMNIMLIIKNSIVDFLFLSRILFSHLNLKLLFFIQGFPRLSNPQLPLLLPKPLDPQSTVTVEPYQLY